MESSMTATTLRIIIAVIGVVILACIYVFGRPRRPKAERRPQVRPAGGARVEPVLGEAADAADDAVEAGAAPAQGELDVALERELAQLGDAIAAGHDRAAPVAATPSAPALPVEHIVTLHVAAREGELLHGSDIVVAAEKVGLRFGDRRIFHRLLDARPDSAPIFSMANMVKPGYFPMDRIGELTTPGIIFFATLPGPLPALDAWEAMLPAAQRVAELLDGLLLDADRNALGRQRIASLREELREWDRQHGDPDPGPPRR
jgi:cell division protein ZipA